MSKTVHSVKLQAYDSIDLDRLSFSNGDVVFDDTNNTLRIMDGNTIGGKQLLRADLSNLSTSAALSVSSIVATGTITAANFSGSISSLQVTTALGFTPVNPTTLNGYVTSTNLTTTLNSYVTSTNLTTTLNSYVTSTGNAATSTAILGGVANQLVYQTGVGTTAFVTVPSVANTFLQWNGTGFTWVVASASGTVTSVGGTGTISGITLSGTVTTSGNLTLGGALSLVSPPAIGSTTPNTGQFTILTVTSASTSSVTLSPTGSGTVTINPTTAGAINNMSVGATTALSGAFTTLSASSTVSGTGFSTYLASPPAIGGTTPAAGSFSSLTDSGNLTFTGTGNRITGDFSNGTHTNRVCFQSSTVNGNTLLEVLTNGTATTSAVNLANTNDNLNCGIAQLQMTSASLNLIANLRGTGTYLPMTFQTSGSESMRIDTSGNVLVGTTITPTVGTNVTKNLVVSNDISSGSLLLGTYGSFLGRQASDGSTVLNTGQAAIIFSRGAFGTTTESMRIDSSGNVGIGVTPSAWGGTKALEVGSKGTALFNNSSLDSYFTQNAYFASGWTYGSTAAASTYRQYAGSHSWQTAPSGTAGNGIIFTQAMTLDASGNFMVGTTTYNNNNSSNSFAFNIQTGNQYCNHIYGTASGTGYLQFGYNGTAIGSITQNGTTAVLYNITSDYRLKTDATPIQNALATVEALNPVSFTWIDGRKDDGFLAHEIQAVIPNCVTGEKDAVNEDGTPKYQQMDNSGVIPFLVKAIQELNAKVDAQALEIAQLKGK